MANKKLDRLRREKKKIQEKILVLQQQEAALDVQIEEQENLDIVGIVRAEGFTLEEFSELMKKIRENPLPDRTQNKEDHGNEKIPEG